MINTKFINRIRSFVVIGLVVCGITSVRAQDMWVSGPQTFTLAATIKYAAPGTFEVVTDNSGSVPKDSFDKSSPAYESTFNTYNSSGDIKKSVYTASAVLKTVRYDNAALLRDLNKAGLLPDEKTSGWSLVGLINGDSGYSIVARKKINDETIDVLVGTASLGEVYLPTGTYTDTDDFTYKSNGDVVQVKKVTGKYASEGSANIELGSLGMNLTAYFTETGSEYAYYPDKEDTSFMESFYLSGGVNFTGGLGSTTYEDNTGSYESIVIATGKIGKASAVKVLTPPL